MAAQMKAFLDSTGGLWQSGGLVGKPVSMFVSAGTQGGGVPLHLEQVALDAGEAVGVLWGRRGGGEERV